MTARRCIPWPDKRLRTPAIAVEEVTDEIRAIWRDMVDTMEAMPGVGLAAKATASTEIAIESVSVNEPPRPTPPRSSVVIVSVASPV